jgi:hypothetical protein
MPYGTVYANSCGSPPPPLADVSDPPAGTSTVFPNTASGALVDVGSAFRYTIAPVVRLSAISVPSCWGSRTAGAACIFGGPELQWPLRLATVPLGKARFGWA